MKAKSFIITAVFILALSGKSWANSDGDYCIGKEYIAYEFSGLSKATPLDDKQYPKHILTIIFFGGPQGMSKPIEFELKQFQPHGMQCNDTNIRFVGWEQIETVTFSNRNRFESKTERKQPGGPFAGYESKNLASWSGVWIEKPKIETIYKTSSFTYQLRIKRDEIEKPSAKYERGLIHSISEIIKINSKGQIVDSFVIYSEKHEPGF